MRPESAEMGLSLDAPPVKCCSLTDVTVTDRGKPVTMDVLTND